MAFWIDWLDKLRDPGRSPHERRYRLLTLMTTILLLLWMAESLSRSTSLMRANVLFVANIVFTASWLWALRFKKTQQHAKVLVLVMVFLVLPGTLVYARAMQSDALYWCLLAMTYTVAAVNGTWKYALLACNLLMTAGCFLFTFFHPEYALQLAEEEAYLNAITQLTGTLMVMGSMLFFQMYMARQEREILSAQQNENGARNRARVMPQTDDARMPADGIYQPADSVSVRIAVDSGCDIPEQWRKRFGIAVINHQVHTNAGTFEDVVETNTDAIFRYMARTDHPVRTEAPSVESFFRFFSSLLERSGQVVFISMGKQVSKSYERACEAAEQTGHVTVIDSGYLSCAAGLLALYAAHLSEREKVSRAFFDQLEIYRQRIQHSLLLDDTEHLVRNGRMGKTTQRLMQAFLLRPVITTKNGEISVKGMVWGDVTRHRERYVKATLKKENRIDQTMMILIHGGLQDEELEEICALIGKQMHFDRIVIQKLSPAVAGNAGPGCFGFVYCMKDIREKAGAFSFLPEDTYEERVV